MVPRPSPDMREEIIIVAPAGWASRVDEILGDSLNCDPTEATRITRHDNVYQAAAAALLARRRGQRVTLAVMVDYLAPPEMEVFGAFAHEPSVTTIAFSACDRRKKLVHARLLGADKVLGQGAHYAPRGREKATEAAAEVKADLEKPILPAGAAVLRDMASRAIAAAGQSPQPAKTPDRHPPKASPPANTPAISSNPEPRPASSVKRANTRPNRPAARPGEPLLTQEELDALLG